MIKQIGVNELFKLIEDGTPAQIVDVREGGEFATERIAAARLIPLTSFAKRVGEIDRRRPVYLLCRTQNRSRRAADELMKRGYTDIGIVAGGITAWKAAGLPLVNGDRNIWSLERQVRFVAGLLVVVGSLLAILVNLYFIALPVFVGAGLVFSAATDTCGMAMILARLPWNSAKGACDAVTQKA